MSGKKEKKQREVKGIGVITHDLLLLREAQKHCLKMRGFDRVHKVTKKSDEPRKAEEKD